MLARSTWTAWKLGWFSFRHLTGSCMPRPKLVTSAAINQIELWVNDGLSAATIAEKIGCTLGTLRVRCSQFGISLRRKKSPVAAVCCSGVPAECPQGTPSSLGGKRAATTLRMVTARTEKDATDEEEEGHLVIRMAPPTIHLLRSRAAKKGISECALATMLLEIIVRDDLYEAVLDETSTETSRRTATLVLNPPRQS